MKPHDEREYREYVGKLKPYDLSGLGGEVIDAFCDAEKCEAPKRKA